MLLLDLTLLFLSLTFQLFLFTKFVSPPVYLTRSTILIFVKMWHFLQDVTFSWNVIFCEKHVSNKCHFFLNWQDLDKKSHLFVIKLFRRCSSFIIFFPGSLDGDACFFLQEHRYFPTLQFTTELNSTYQFTTLKVFILEGYCYIFLDFLRCSLFCFSNMIFVNSSNFPNISVLWVCIPHYCLCFIWD